MVLLKISNYQNVTERWNELMKPDYQSYSLADLYDVRSRIDKDTYPERYEELLKEIAQREKHKSEVTNAI